jgi:hypothetical protein
MGGTYTFWTVSRKFPAFKVFDRTKDYYIPAGAPVGLYTFYLRLLHNGIEVDRDSFPFDVIN